VIRNPVIKLVAFYIISISFILLNAWFVIKKDTLLFSTLPVALIIILFVIYSFDKIVYIVIFFFFFFISLHKLVPGVNFNMFLPTEPLLFGLLIIFLLKVIYERGFDRRILQHPVSMAIYINLLWIFLSGLTSTMPVVSFKFLLSRIWFVVGLYFLTVGTFLGGVWANESWGRYWGWDPKETWALITVVVYSFIVHMRLIPSLKGVFNYTVASVVGFVSVIMT